MFRLFPAAYNIGMDLGDFLTRWTVRGAMVFYVFGLASFGWRRAAWTAGCALYLLHVIAAFAFFHNWSHDEAYAFTAEQSAAVAGLRWGGGLFVNYLFTVVWVGDVGWRWLSPASHRNQPRWLTWTVHGFLGFIAFNATVVFASGFSRWFGIAACVLLSVPRLRQNHSPQRHRGTEKGK